MSLLLSSYVLIWPLLSAGVLAMLLISLVRDMRAARRNGDSMI
ncbi:putative transporter small subunit [Paracandidimonas lactea]|nr:putative transporter small subunit [Paracandidimonas lactea]